MKNFLKKQLTRENLILILLLVLLGHNYYLQTEVELASAIATDAYYEADEASDNAEDALNAATESAELSGEAAYYSQQASDYAEDAADNAFGNECWSCPGY